jgi:hypothetical protein
MKTYHATIEHFKKSGDWIATIEGESIDPTSGKSAEETIRETRQKLKNLGAPFSIKWKSITRK